MNKKLSAVSRQRSAKLALVGADSIRDRSRLQIAPTIGLLTLLLLSPATFAASVITTSTIDGGGKRATSANYTMDGSVGGIGGISTVASPPETVKAGYLGQLTEVTGLSVTGTPPIINEGATSQLGGSATLDDSTLSVLAGSEIAWGSAAYPLASINGNGLATAAAVYATTNGTFSGWHLGGSGSGILAVIDSNPDNYGTYAGDNIADSWQVQYFGLNNPSAGPTNDVTGTGQNNLFKYVAGLDPTNPASVFVLQIQNVGGQPSQKNLLFNPVASGRTYTPQFRTNLVSGAWATLTGFGGPTTNINQVIVTDLSATQTQKFYRIDISLP